MDFKTSPIEGKIAALGCWMQLNSGVTTDLNSFTQCPTQEARDSPKNAGKFASDHSSASPKRDESPSHPDAVGKNALFRSKSEVYSLSQALCLKCGA